MSETIDMGLSPEARHPEPVISPEDLRESEPEIAAFEEILTLFELEHPPSKLRSIIDLRPEDAPNHPVREPARIALIPLATMMNKLKKETNISPEKLKNLKARYKTQSNNVGIINDNNKVDHDR